MCNKCEAVDSWTWAKNKDLGFYTSKEKPNGQFAIICDGTYEGEETGERFMIDVSHCPWCGEALSKKDNYMG